MKLYEVPERKQVKIRIVEDSKHKAPPVHREFEEKEILTFSHVDGMYSVCFDKDDKLVHLFAGTEVEIVK